MTSGQMSTNFFLAGPIIMSIMINFQNKIFISIETKEFCCEIFHFCEAYFSLVNATSSIWNKALQRVWPELSEMV